MDPFLVRKAQNMTLVTFLSLDCDPNHFEEGTAYFLIQGAKNPREEIAKCASSWGRIVVQFQSLLTANGEQSRCGEGL